ncbi:hypothetical protein EIN_489380 [Entamoeba invadens IP1]|uniref:Uncharacterized protein n=1 Tax=Entamoeba invadens IP1 TaxID=370355 RepID=L7FLB4_ENTIV|nr:hypothetical protein EIN_489380 [Entamoeba invadens IP1]ELP87651.1 hypothetical protein EIN_489380 [Entamoeba invadens IP1]|eukprot:XP_004254422.1 hypothetical protein EIN_489380 [Entamoeba invadens IP1]
MNIIHPEVFVKHRSINLLIGKPGCSKTTSICKELIKIDKVSNSFHLIIWVNNTGSDQTLLHYEPLINIPILKFTYEQFEKAYPKFLEIKKTYNKMMRKEIPKDESILECLYLDKFSDKPLETIIVLDGAVNCLKNESSLLSKSLYKTRHTNCLFFIAIQIWRGIPAQIKSILSTVWIFNSFSPQILHHIYNQITTNISFEEFQSVYNQLEKYEKDYICFVR